MNTWEVIKFLTENPNSDKVFVSYQKNKVYDIYLDDYTKEFIIDERIPNSHGWMFKTNLNNIELNKILWINNWK